MAASMAEAGNFRLAAVLDLTQASVLHRKLMAMRGRDIVIDASGVDRIGVQCVQVLMAGSCAWRRDNKRFSIENASDAYRKTMQLIGVDI